MPRQAPASRLTLAGQPHRLLGRQHDRLGGGAERAPPLPVPDPHPLAHARGRHAFADAIDLAGAVAVRDHAREGDLAGGAGAALDVGRIDPGGAQPNAHFARARLRRIDLGDAQHLAGGAVLLVIGSAHGDLLHVSLEMISRSPADAGAERFVQNCPALRPTCPGETSNISARASISANCGGVGAGHPDLRAELSRARHRARRAATGRDGRRPRRAAAPARSPTSRRAARRGRAPADQQRLLLAGRRIGGRDVLAGIGDREIGEVRPVERAAGGGVAGAVVPAAPRDSGPRPRPPDVRRRASPSSRRARSRPPGTARPARCGRRASPAGAPPSRPASRVTATASSAVSCSMASSQCGSGRGSSSSRLRERSDRSSALTRVMCSASTASTSRSRKRRRSEAGR